jgi:F-type H+-transporting ATPase subunit delta
VAAHPELREFFENPTIGKRAKSAALTPGLADSSPLLRGFIGVLLQNNRLELFRPVAQAYARILDRRAGRVPVLVTAAVEPTDEQREKIAANLKKLLDNREPVLDVRVDPDLLGGMVVRVGDTVIDTSVRTRLQSLRNLLLAR